MKIARFRGIEIKLSGFWLLLILICYGAGILHLALPVFAIVIAHEMGHVGLALYLGIKVEAIEIFPFGGVARVQNPYVYSLPKEVALALMGPLINFVLGGIFWLCLKFNLGHPDSVNFLVQVTLAMGLANLLPVLPLDGGRIFRAILAQALGFFSAVKIVSVLGQILAAGLFLWGSWQVYQSWINFPWLLAAAYLYYVARQERRVSFFRFMRYLTHKEKEIKRAGLLPAAVLVAVKTTKLKQVIKVLAPYRYHWICVLDDRGNFLGLLSEHAVIKAALRGSMHLTLEELLSQDRR